MRNTTTSKNKRILVVDDDQGIRSSLSRILRSYGHEVQVAKDGLEAIGFCNEFPPDLLLIDIRMPGIDGVETFRRLRERWPSLVAIFMTAYSSSEKSVEAEQRGAISVLAKPLNLARLMDLVQASLSAAPILIVDDDSALLKSISRALGSKGIEVETAASLRAAVHALRQRPNRVVVADVFLNDGFGYQLLDEFGDSEEHPPLVLITGRPEWKDSEMAHQVEGKVVCLTKPIDIDQLISKVIRS
jgi:DNA-binding NtrC family response regulator